VSSSIATVFTNEPTMAKAACAWRSCDPWMGDATPKGTTTTSLQRLAHGYTELTGIITGDALRAHRYAAAVQQGRVF
jgi:hypothetical protein